VSFFWREGVFDYIESVARKIEIGKVTETSQALGDNDLRINELLLYRATIGARVNRLELQESRLEYTQESYTGLLGKVEDADIAQVIMDLKMQESVYQAALAAGARIIMPTLVDFLS
jgi:flagellar hook-associated protein 3 FlgL